MSKTIKILIELIEEELESAEKYAELANTYKIDRPDLAKEFCTKSEDEIKHAMTWHDWVAKDVEKKKIEIIDKTEPILLKMIVRWEIAHEYYIEELNEIKREISIFKSM